MGNKYRNDTFDDHRWFCRNFFHTVHFDQSAGNHYPKIYPQSTLRI